MVVSDDLGDLSVILDLGENSLADLRVLFHLASLGEGQRAGLLEQAWRQADLPDVVNETANVSKPLSLLR
jgi:hypothetical protein